LQAGTSFDKNVHDTTIGNAHELLVPNAQCIHLEWNA